MKSNVLFLKEDGQTFRKSFAGNLSWPTYRRVGLEHATYKILADEKSFLLMRRARAVKRGGPLSRSRDAN